MSDSSVKWGGKEGGGREGLVLWRGRKQFVGEQSWPGAEFPCVACTSMSHRAVKEFVLCFCGYLSCTQRCLF